MFKSLYRFQPNTLETGFQCFSSGSNKCAMSIILLWMDTYTNIRDVVMLLSDMTNQHTCKEMRVLKYESIKPLATNKGYSSQHYVLFLLSTNPLKTKTFPHNAITLM